MPDNSSFYCPASCLVPGDYTGMPHTSVLKVTAVVGEGKGSRDHCCSGWAVDGNKTNKSVLSNWENGISGSESKEGKGETCPGQTGLLELKIIYSWIPDHDVQIFIVKRHSIFLLKKNLVKDNSLNPTWLCWGVGLSWKTNYFSLCRFLLPDGQKFHNICSIIF